MESVPRHNLKSPGSALAAVSIAWDLLAQIPLNIRQDHAADRYACRPRPGERGSPRPTGLNRPDGQLHNVSGRGVAGPRPRRTQPLEDARPDELPAITWNA